MVWDGFGVFGHELHYGGNYWNYPDPFFRGPTAYDMLSILRF